MKFNLFSKSIHTMPSSVTYDNTSYSVTSIGDDAFTGLRVRVRIPSSVKYRDTARESEAKDYDEYITIEECL